MSTKRRVSLLLIILFAVTTLFAAIPEWYVVDFGQYGWFADNQTDIQWNYIHRTIGQVQVRKANNWWSYQNQGAIWNGNFTLVISSPLNDFHLTNVDDSTKTFPGEVFVDLEDGTDEYNFTSSPGRVDFTLPTPDDSILPRFYLTITPNFDNQTEYQGTYTSVIHMEVYVDYDDVDNRVLIGESYFNVLVYFITKSEGSSGGGTIFTNLMISRYPQADGIDIPTLQTTQGSLTVAGVTFSSNDNKSNSSYEILVTPISPPGALNTDSFAFFKDGNPAIYIPYKVHAPTRTPSYTGEFSVVPPAIGPAGYWTDFFELGITEINYSDRSYTVGDYTSLIQIQLIKN